MPILADIVAGGGVGLLLGYLLGLSVSPVVQGVVVAITGLLGALLGLQQGAAGMSWRIGAFGIFCTAGVTLGLFVRSGSLLTPSVKQEVAQWQAAGYLKQDALAFVAYLRLGIKPAGITISDAPEAKQQANALYAQDSRSVCNVIGLVKDVDQKLAIVRRFPAYAALADASAKSADPEGTLMRGLKCGG
jgi:hypothetical protein